MRLLGKSNIISLILLIYVISWLVGVAALNVYVVVPSGFLIVNSSVILGSLTLLQAFGVIFYAVVGGLVALMSGFFFLVRVGRLVIARWASLKVETAPVYNPAPYPEEHEYPLELAATFSRLVDFLRLHPFSVGVPLVVFGPLLLVGFSFYVQRQTPLLGGDLMFQLLIVAVPILCIVAIILGVAILLNYFYKKSRVS